MPKMPADWIESTPEWKACFGLIDDEEYLRLTANYGREITPEHRANLLKRKQCAKASNKPDVPLTPLQE